MRYVYFVLGLLFTMLSVISGLALLSIGVVFFAVLWVLLLITVAAMEIMTYCLGKVV